MHWSSSSGSACSPEGNACSECHTESTENQGIVLISRLNLWQTIQVCFLLLAHFISQTLRAAHLQGWCGGNQIFPLEQRCFGFLLAPILGNGSCFHKDGYKLGIFPKLVRYLPMSCFFFPLLPDPRRDEPQFLQPCYLSPPPSCWLWHCFRNQVLPGGTNCMTPLCIKGSH